MKGSIRKLIFAFSIACSLLILVILCNQIYQLSLMLGSIHPVFGRVVGILLMLISFATILFPIWGFMHLRKPLPLPEADDATAIATYQKKLAKRLNKNNILKEAGVTIDVEGELEKPIQEAMAILDAEAERAIREAAARVFTTTAISQNGSLDALFVSFNLSKLIWRVSHIYNQRPHVHNIIQLYGNVGATIMLSKGIEDSGLLEEQLTPLINSIVGASITSAIPGAVAISNLIVSSIIEGAANAFLTLRVGLIARGYSQAITQPDKAQVKKSAIIEACSLLGKVVGENSVNLARAVMVSAKKATIDKTVDSIKAGTRSLKDKILAGLTFDDSKVAHNGDDGADEAKLLDAAH